MKIYEIGTGYTPIPAEMGAATEIVVEELTKAFLKQGQAVEIIDIAAKDRRPHQLPIREVKVPGCFTSTDVKLGIMHKLKRVVYSMALAGALKKILRETEEKVVLHFHNQYNLFFFLKLTSSVLRKKCLIAYTNHSYIWHGKWDEIEEVVHKRYFQEVYGVKHADHIFVLNEQTNENLIQHVKVPADRIHLVDNGVNVETYFIAPEVGEEKKIFVQVGSVCDRKNQLESVRLLLPLMQENRDVIFRYAGGIIDMEYHASITAFAKEHGIADQVQYVGELQPGKELNAFYNSAEAMIFPSKAEGFSLVVIEAMAAGVPVIINSDLEFGLKDSCLRYRHDEDFIRIIKEQILEPDKRADLSQSVRKVVVNEYSWEKIARDYCMGWKD